MKESVFKKIISDLQTFGYTGILRTHFYNEPLLDKRLPRLIRYAKDHLPKTTIILHTNGDYLTETLFDTLLASGVNKIIATGHEGKLSAHLKRFSKMKKFKPYLSTPIIKTDMPLFNRGGLVSVKKLIPITSCNLAYDYCVIDYTGNVVLCCNDYLSSVVFGNVMKENIMDIWKKKEYAYIRNSTHNGKFILEICKRCIGKNVPTGVPISKKIIV